MKNKCSTFNLTLCATPGLLGRTETNYTTQQIKTYSGYFHSEKTKHECSHVKLLSNNHENSAVSVCSLYLKDQGLLDFQVGCLP